jgi:YHS domain-containing protein
MIRTVLYLLISILLITFVRAVVGLITRTLGQMINPPPPGNPQTSHAGFGGELKQDPVCGIFVSQANAVKKTVKGQVLHFCSTACRDKYKG